MKRVATYAALGLSAFALGWCTRERMAPPAQVYEVTAVRRDTVKGDPEPYAVPVPAPRVRYVAAAPDTVHVGADTAAILACYFAERRYADTLLNDTSAFIALAESVQRNRITSRSLMFQNRRPTLITTATTTITLPQEPQVQLYLSVMAGRELTAPVVQVAWRRWKFSAGYDLRGGGIVGGVGYRIR